MPTGVYLPRGENSTVKTAGLMIELYNHRDSGFYSTGYNHHIRGKLVTIRYTPMSANYEVLTNHNTAVK